MERGHGAQIQGQKKHLIYLLFHCDDRLELARVYTNKYLTHRATARLLSLCNLTEASVRLLYTWFRFLFVLQFRECRIYLLQYKRPPKLRVQQTYTYFGQISRNVQTEVIIYVLYYRWYTRIRLLLASTILKVLINFFEKQITFERVCRTWPNDIFYVAELLLKKSVGEFNFLKLVH